MDALNSVSTRFKLLAAHPGHLRLFIVLAAIWLAAIWMVAATWLVWGPLPKAPLTGEEMFLHVAGCDMVLDYENCAKGKDAMVGAWALASRFAVVAVPLYFPFIVGAVMVIAEWVRLGYKSASKPS